MITRPIQRTPEYFRARLSALARNAARLYERADAGEEMSARDAAMAAEYNQTYIDILTEIEDCIEVKA